jgi:hypothetical protein
VHQETEEKWKVDEAEKKRKAEEAKHEKEAEQEHEAKESRKLKRLPRKGGPRQKEPRRLGRRPY